MAAPDRSGVSSPVRRWSPPVDAWVETGPSLLVADENAAASGDLRQLIGAGLSAILCGDGAEALWHAGRLAPEAVILSATLPGVPAADVAAVLARHREGRETIVVGVGSGEADLAGPVVAAGATGVVSRPYRSREILPLVRQSLLQAERRSQQSAVLTVGVLRLDGPAFEASVAGRPLRLPLREFELLRLLLASAGKVVTHEQIRRRLWHERGESITSNTIAVHVRRLRAHLEGVADIVVVRGVGYRLLVEGE